MACLLCALGWGGCTPPDLLSFGAPRFVVQSVLTAATATQVLWLEQTTDPGSLLTAELLPVSPPPSAVLLRDDSGVLVATFTQDPGNAARFLASFVPAPGAEYHLMIALGADTLTASVVVPSVAISLPSTDSVTLLAQDTLDLHWTVTPAEARTLPLILEDDAGADTLRLFGRFTQDTTALYPAAQLAPSRSIWIVVADPWARAAFEVRTGPIQPNQILFYGNVRGAAGVFGAVRPSSCS